MRRSYFPPSAGAVCATLPLATANARRLVPRCGSPTSPRTGNDSLSECARNTERTTATGVRCTEERHASQGKLQRGASERRRRELPGGRTELARTDRQGLALEKVSSFFFFLGLLFVFLCIILRSSFSGSSVVR